MKTEANDMAKRQEYITYHAFKWRFAASRFKKLLLSQGGLVVEEKTKKKRYCLKVSNPTHNMHKAGDKLYKVWYLSSRRYWKEIAVNGAIQWR